MGRVDSFQGGEAPLDREGVTVHLVGQLTPSVLSFLLPAIQALAAAGRRQALLFVEDGLASEQLGPVPADIYPVRVHGSDSPLRRCATLFHALLQFSRERPIHALHLHGMLPALVASRLSRGLSERGVELFLSPHSSRLLGRTVAMYAVLRSLRRLRPGDGALRVIVNVQREVRLLARFSGLDVQLIECPVPSVFFETPRQESARPRLIVCNAERHVAALDGFLRLAVLLNDERLGIEFHAIGTGRTPGREALQAAGVTFLEAPSSSARAERLGTAWVYVATWEERGFPIHLAEAMAAGLPCVALDTETHRGMVVNGETGYLYENVREMLERIGQLVDSQPLRERLGQSARRHAELRFRESDFRKRLAQAVSTRPRAAPPQSGDDLSPISLKSFP